MKVNENFFYSIFVLFSSKDFKPFHVGLSPDSAEVALQKLFSETFSGKKSSLNKVIKKNWEQGHEILAHEIQSEVEKKDSKKMLKYWQNEINKKGDSIYLGDTFSKAMQKEFEINFH